MRHKTDMPRTAHDPRVEFFGGLAERWDEVGQNPSATVARLAELSGLLQLKPGTDLLEVGCGTGQITGWLAEQVAPGKVVAVDFAEAMLQQARRKHRGRRLSLCRCVPRRSGYAVFRHDPVLSFLSALSGSVGGSSESGPCATLNRSPDRHAPGRQPGDQRVP